MHIELTNGNSAELVDDLSGITNDQRDELEFAYAEASPAPDEEKASELRRLKSLWRAVIRLAIVSWTLPEPIPSEDPSVLGRISGLDGKLLEEAAWELRMGTRPLDTSLAAVEKGEDGRPSTDAPFLSSKPSLAPSSIGA